LGYSPASIFTIRFPDRDNAKFIGAPENGLILFSQKNLQHKMSFTKSGFKTSITNALTYMRENPTHLMLTPKDMMAKLDASVKSNGQGTANKACPHEASIALVWESNGFSLAPRKVVPADDGYYYWYQPNGSQQKPDFVLFWVLEGVKQSEVIFDAKQGSKDTILLNDGWFHEDYIYIVSFTSALKRGTARSQLCLIALGQDIGTEQDNKIMRHIVEIKKELNQSKKSMLTSFLKICFRFANQYSCKQFTEEFRDYRFQKTVSWLLPSDE
jgi:hypothetical protein